MGPLITDRHRDSIESYVAMGVEDGGQLRTGGVRPVARLRERLLLHAYHHRRAG